MAKKVKKSKSSKKKKSKVSNDKLSQAIMKKSKKKKKSKKTQSMLIEAVIVATAIEESPEKTPKKENSKAEKKAKKKAKKAKKKSKEKAKKKKKKKERKKKKKSIQTESEPESISIDGAERLETPEPFGKPQSAKQEDGDSDDSSEDIAPKLEGKKDVEPMDNSDSDDSSEDDSVRPPSTPVSVSVQPRSSIDIASEKKMMDIPAKGTTSGSDLDGSDSDTTALGKDKTEGEPKPNPDDNSSSSESDNKITPGEKEAENPATKDMSDTDNSDSSSSEEQQKAPEAEAAITDSSVSKTDTKPAANPGKSNKRKKEFDDKSTDKKKRAYGESGFAGGRTRLKGKTKRVFVGNLNYSINDEIIKDFFKDIGEITDIYWLTDKRSGEFKGAGFVTFETAEAATKAVEEKSGRLLLRRSVKLDWTQERTGGGSKKSGTVPDWVSEPISKRPKDCTTVFLGNLDFKVTEEDVRNHLKDCGEIKSVRFIEKNGEFQGAGFADFESVQGADNAVKLCGKAILGRPSRVDYAKSRTFS